MNARLLMVHFSNLFTIGLNTKRAAGFRDSHRNGPVLDCQPAADWLVQQMGRRAMAGVSLPMGGYRYQRRGAHTQILTGAGPFVN